MNEQLVKQYATHLAQQTGISSKDNRDMAWLDMLDALMRSGQEMRSAEESATQAQREYENRQRAASYAAHIAKENSNGA